MNLQRIGLANHTKSHHPIPVLPNPARYPVKMYRSTDCIWLCFASLYNEALLCLFCYSRCRTRIRFAHAHEALSRYRSIPSDAHSHSLRSRSRKSLAMPHSHSLRSRSRCAVALSFDPERCAFALTTFALTLRCRAIDCSQLVQIREQARICPTVPVGIARSVNASSYQCIHLRIRPSCGVHRWSSGSVQ